MEEGRCCTISLSFPFSLCLSPKTHTHARAHADTFVLLYFPSPPPGLICGCVPVPSFSLLPSLPLSVPWAPQTALISAPRTAEEPPGRLLSAEANNVFVMRLHVTESPGALLTFTVLEHESESNFPFALIVKIFSITQKKRESFLGGTADLRHNLFCRRRQGSTSQDDYSWMVKKAGPGCKKVLKKKESNECCPCCFT